MAERSETDQVVRIADSHQKNATIRGGNPPSECPIILFKRAKTATAQTQARTLSAVRDSDNILPSKLGQMNGLWLVGRKRVPDSEVQFVRYVSGRVISLSSLKNSTSMLTNLPRFRRAQRELIQKPLLAFSIAVMGNSFGPVSAEEIEWTAGSGTNFLWSDAFNWSLWGPTSVDDVFLTKPIPNPGALSDPHIITLDNGEVANSLTFLGPYTLTAPPPIPAPALSQTSGLKKRFPSSHFAGVTLNSSRITPPYMTIRAMAVPWGGVNSVSTPRRVGRNKKPLRMDFPATS